MIPVKKIESIDNLRNRASPLAYKCKSQYISISTHITGEQAQPTAKIFSNTKKGQQHEKDHMATINTRAAVDRLRGKQGDFFGFRKSRKDRYDENRS